MADAITKIEIPGVEPSHSGKVRDIFDLGDQLLLVATDRISAFDCIMPRGVPEKGKLLTTISKFWFETLSKASPHHVITTEVSEFPEPFNQHPEILDKRSMLVHKTETIPVECVVRGYLAGSVVKEYQEKQTVCNVLLDKGLNISDKLRQAVYTPAKKNHEGHDENISYEETVRIVGGWESDEIRNRSLDLYAEASKITEERGLLLADSKFEFGFLDDEVILIDELFTMDSSRFWSKEEYTPGVPQNPFDKQFVRDYLNGLDWDKTPPAPDLPDEIIEKTLERYIKAYEMITGEKWT